MKCHECLMGQNVASHNEFHMSFYHFILSCISFALDLHVNHYIVIAAVKTSFVMPVSDCTRGHSWYFLSLVSHLLDSSFTF